MRILFTIPHYFGPGPSCYGSTDTSKRKQRIDSLRSCIASLHQHFGRSQNLLLQHGGGTQQVNQMLSNDIDVVVCVNGSNHLLDELGLPPGSYQSREFIMDNPLFLGFSCYEVLREANNHYDWYCYLEDDIVVSDSLFFCKLQEFYRVINNARYLLQPNRYELGADPDFSKVYVDGPIWSDSAEFLSELRLPGCCDEIMVKFGASAFRMTPTPNPHSGCFFLTNVHLHHLLEQPWYGNLTVGYAGPLESAATQYLITLFHVFKPDLECLSFLEVHHHHQKYVKNYLL
ncbi:MAG: hypothetical protein ACOYL3_02590 [Desulfuromonadaceae bacterium]